MRVISGWQPIERRLAVPPSMQRIRVDGDPQSQGSKTIVPAGFAADGRQLTRLIDAKSRGGQLTTEPLDHWRSAIEVAGLETLAHNGWPRPMSGPLALVAVFWMRRPKSAAKRLVWCAVKPDLSKVVRALEDSLTPATGKASKGGCAMIEEDSRFVEFLVLQPYEQPDHQPGVDAVICSLDETTLEQRLRLHVGNHETIVGRCAA